MSKYRDWCWKYVSEDEQDSGANDEGYYYHFCNSCYRRTEHEAGSCCQCGEYNDPEYWDYKRYLLNLYSDQLSRY